MLQEEFQLILQDNEVVQALNRLDAAIEELGPDNVKYGGAGDSASARRLLVLRDCPRLLLSPICAVWLLFQPVCAVWLLFQPVCAVWLRFQPVCAVWLLLQPVCGCSCDCHASHVCCNATSTPQSRPLANSSDMPQVARQARVDAKRAEKQRLEAELRQVSLVCGLVAAVLTMHLAAAAGGEQSAGSKHPTGPNITTARC